MTVDRPGRMLVFDGDCGFCSRYAYWIAARLPADVEVVPWQTIDDLEAIGLTERDVECAAWWIDGRGRWAGGDAIAWSLRAAPGAWPLLGRLMLIWPFNYLSRSVYRWVADNRGRLPGATPACQVDGRDTW